MRRVVLDGDVICVKQVGLILFVVVRLLVNLQEERIHMLYFVLV